MFYFGVNKLFFDSFNFGIILIKVSIIFLLNNGIKIYQQILYILIFIVYLNEREFSIYLVGGKVFNKEKKVKEKIKRRYNLMFMVNYGREIEMFIQLLN